MRQLLLAVAVTVGLTGSVSALSFDIPSPATPAQMAVTSKVVLVGKVTAIEKKLVTAPSPYPPGVEGKAGAKVTHTYKVAVVKVETGLAGADGLKEVKVGVAQPKPGEKGAKPVELKEGQRVLMFLTKHPHADLHLLPTRINAIQAPVDVTTANGKNALKEVERALMIAADPVKALKSDKAEARVEAAVLMVMKYRAYPDHVLDADEVAISAEESELILKGLMEGTWKMRDDGPARTSNPYHAFVLLPLDGQPGWTDPLLKLPPDRDYAAHSKEAFAKWRAGPGKGYVLTKIAPLRAEKK